MSGVVIISGMPGSGNSTVGELLAKKLGYKFFSVGKYFKGHSGNKKETQAALEVLGTKKGTSKEFHNSIEDMQKKLARKGNVVIEGKLSVHFLQNHGFTVWLKGSFKERAKRYSKKDDIPIQSAREQLKAKQERERKMWERIYGFDYFKEEKEADLIIDTTHKKPEEITKEIIENID